MNKLELVFFWMTYLRLNYDSYPQIFYFNSFDKSERVPNS